MRHGEEQLATGAYRNYHPNQFFLFSSVIVAVTSFGCWALQQVWPHSAKAGVPPAFWISTPLLGAGSCWLWRAVHHVKRERQMAFRSNLTWALGTAVAFVILQSHALLGLKAGVSPKAVQIDADAFILVFASLHAFHFVVAVLVLVFVFVQAGAGRYDHEYHWGVTVCASFWHILGLAWCAILGATIVSLGLY